MSWRRIKAGLYEHDPSGWTVILQDHEAEDDREGQGAVASEWFLYDQDTYMIDGYPTLKAAKAAAYMEGLA